VLRSIVLTRKVFLGALLGLLSAGVTAGFGSLPFARTVELKTYDLRMRLVTDPAEARQDIVLVDISEDSIRRLEPTVGRWPWPRLVHGALIDFLARAPVRVIGYDVIFGDRDRRSGFPVGDSTWTGAESDQAFADSVKRAGTVLMTGDATFGGVETETTSPPTSRDAPYVLDESIEGRPVWEPPYDELASAARGIGHNLFVFDEDGPLRRSVPFVRFGDRAVPLLGVAVALSRLGIQPTDVRLENEDLVLGTRRMPLLRARVPGERGEVRSSRRALVRFPGPALLPDGHTQTYKTYSFYDLFYSEQQLLAGEKPMVDPAVFREKIVLVGSTAAGLNDVFPNPFGSAGAMPGMQVHASVADNVLSDRFLRPLGWRATLLAAIAGAVVVGLAAVLVNVWLTGLVAVVVTGVLVWLGFSLFDRGLWLELTTPVLAVAVATFSGVTYQWVVEGREKRKVKRLFSRYVAPDVYRQLLEDPARARLGGQRREMTVLFSDIRGFTTVSERGQPEDIVSQLNEYFSRMVDVLFAHKGTLDKFVGDMVMALYGAPIEDEQHADHAVTSAVAMVEELRLLNARWASEGRPPLDIGIGINSGEMVAGNIGSDTIMSYTVIGDQVNLGARLESLNKEYGTRIIISESTRQRLKGRYDIRPLGDVVVKGKTQPVAIFEVRT
jgi:adenylate cyclase